MFIAAGSTPDGEHTFPPGRTSESCRIAAQSPSVVTSDSSYDHPTIRPASATIGTAIVVALAAVALLAFPSVAEGALKPGDPVYTTSRTVETVLQRTVDFADCRGIQRFGMIAGGYIVWDCATELDGRTCVGVRVKSVRGNQSGRVKLIRLRRGRC